MTDNKENKKVFDSEYSAKKYAERVNGTVRTVNLPDYMGVVTCYVVTW